MAGAKPQGKVKIEWSPSFAYAVGLIVSDGSLSKDGRHISFVSKDIEQIQNFITCLGITPKIGCVFGFNHHQAYRVQFGDVQLYKFFNRIGITSAKSLTISALSIPFLYFPDFLRGMFDGDGCTYSYWDKRWRSSFMFYLSFASGSSLYIEWLQEMIFQIIGVKGHISVSKKKEGRNNYYQIRYAKKEAFIVLQKMYYSKDIVHLKRKYLKINAALHIMGKQL